jgi:parvulin-like peptidyl-prolyl isomerase
VARVNGTDISRDVFNRQMEKTRQRFQQAKREIPPALETRLKENIIRKLVDDALISQRAKAEGVSLADAEVDQKLTDHKSRFGSPEAFKSFLERTGQAEEDLRDELRRTELRDRLFNKLAAAEEPPDAEVKEFYDKNLDRYKDREQVKALQVMWKSDPQASADQKKKTEARAKAAASELRKKGVDFKAKIATYTDAAPSPQGGDLGWVPRGRQVKAVEDAIFDTACGAPPQKPGAPAAAPQCPAQADGKPRKCTNNVCEPRPKVGEVVGPISTQHGLHILKIDDKKAERQKPLDEVSAAIKTQIKQRKKSEKTRDILANLKKDAKIDVLEAGVSLEAKVAPPMPGGPGPNSGLTLNPAGQPAPGHPVPGAAPPMQATSPGAPNQPH